MARSKRASMREGPLADLFRSTDESVPPEEIKVTAKIERRDHRGRGHRGSSRDRPGDSHAGARPRADPGAGPRADSRPGPDPLPGPEPVPEPTPPEPVAEGKVEGRAEIHHEGLERLMGGPGIETRPAFGRDEPDRSSRHASAGRPTHAPGRPTGGRRRRRRRQRRQPDGRGGAAGRRVRRDQHRPSVPAELERRRHAAYRRRAHPRARRRVRSEGRLPRRLRGAGQDQGSAQGLRHGLPRLRRRAAVPAPAPPRSSRSSPATSAR